MAVYAVQGKLGTGKTKFCVWRAQEAIRAGLRVASNVDLELTKLTPERRAHYIRIPDKPTPEDLHSIGHGNPESYDEEKNGVLILDELGTWLNSRSFQDKSRAGVLDWLIHARKLGWHVFLIVQDVALIDKQVREAIVEYEVRCLRLDKVRIPFIGRPLGAIAGLFGVKRFGYLPKFHLATARIGSGANQMVAERWSYLGNDLHAAYDTRQAFRSDYPHGTHTVLPPWDYTPPTGWLGALRAKLQERAQVAAVGTRSVPLPRPKLAIVQAIERCLPPDERTRHVARLERLGLL